MFDTAFQAALGVFAAVGCVAVIVVVLALIGAALMELIQALDRLGR